MLKIGIRILNGILMVKAFASLHKVSPLIGHKVLEVFFPIIRLPNILMDLTFLPCFILFVNPVRVSTPGKRIVYYG